MESADIRPSQPREDSTNAPLNRAQLIEFLKRSLSRSQECNYEMAEASSLRDRRGAVPRPRSVVRSGDRRRMFALRSRSAPLCRRLRMGKARPLTGRETSRPETRKHAPPATEIQSYVLVSRRRNRPFVAPHVAAYEPQTVAVEWTVAAARCRDNSI